MFALLPLRQLAPAAAFFTFAACAGPATPAGADLDTTGTDVQLADGAPSDVLPDAPTDAADSLVGDVLASDVQIVDAQPADSQPQDVQPQDTQLVDVQPLDAQSVDAQVVDIAADAATSDAGSSVLCTANPPVFPVFSKTCEKDTDCLVAVHQYNCCGSHVAWGLNVSEKEAFGEAETICAAQYPKCGCAAFATMAEDGYAVFGTATDFAARCESGVCRTYVPGAKPECTSAGLTSPQPFKGCKADSDCGVAFITTDCCGTQQAIGIASFAQGPFQKIADTCAQTMAVCDCMPQPTTQEDGKPLILDGSVGCVFGQCKTGIW